MTELTASCDIRTRNEKSRTKSFKTECILRKSTMKTKNFARKCTRKSVKSWPSTTKMQQFTKKTRNPFAKSKQSKPD